MRRRWYWATEKMVDEGVADIWYFGIFHLYRLEGQRWKWGGWNLD